MRKLFNEVFIFTFLVLPFLLVYAKGLDYYRETVVEPAVGMKCGDGKPIETWYATERILTPTYDCHNKEHYIAYAKWFSTKVPEVLNANEGFIDETISYFKEVTVIVVDILKDITAFFAKKIGNVNEESNWNLIDNDIIFLCYDVNWMDKTVKPYLHSKVHTKKYGGKPEDRRNSQRDEY